MIPEPSLIASRAAISLPSGFDVMRTAAGDETAAWATTSALGATRNSSSSGASATRTLAAPYCASVSLAAS